MTSTPTTRFLKGAGQAGALLIATILLFQVVCAFTRTESATVAATPRAEKVVRTLPLELGEGDERDTKIRFRGDIERTLLAGTRVEILKNQEAPGAPQPQPGVTWKRVRVTSSDAAGSIGYVPSYQIQAAR